MVRKTYKSKRGKNIFTRILFYFSLLSFLAVSVYVFLFSSYVTVSSIKFNGNKIVSDEDLFREINNRIAGKYMGVLNKNCLLLINGRSISRNIENKFKQIRQIKIKKKFPSELIINITERQKKLALCSGGACFLADENGQIYDAISAEEIQKDRELPVLTDESGKAIKIRETFLETDFINYISRIKQKLGNDIGLEIENNFQTPYLISNDIRARTREGWNVYFNLDISLEKEANMLKTVLNKEISDSQKAELEYIDIRIDNKVYYKLKNQAENNIESE